MWLSLSAEAAQPLSYVSSTSQTFTNSSPVYLLYLSPRQVAACISTSPLNWAAWMLNCTWHVRFLMKALFYCRVCSLQFHFDRGGMSTKEKTQPPKSTSLNEHTQTHKGMKKKTYFFCLFCVVFWGNSKTYIYPLGCREMCSSRWSCKKSRHKNVLGNAQHRNHKKQ